MTEIGNYTKEVIDLSKVISIEQAVSMIPDGAAIGIGGFIGSGHPQEFSVGIEESFLKSGHPKDLTIILRSGKLWERARRQ